MINKTCDIWKILIIHLTCIHPLLFSVLSPLRILGSAYLIVRQLQMLQLTMYGKALNWLEPYDSSFTCVLIKRWMRQSSDTQIVPQVLRGLLGVCGKMYEIQSTTFNVNVKIGDFTLSESEQFTLDFRPKGTNRGNFWFFTMNLQCHFIPDPFTHDAV